MDTHPTDACSSYYQYYKSHFQNTNHSIFASAPPLSSPSEHLSLNSSHPAYSLPAISYPPPNYPSHSSSTLYSPDSGYGYPGTERGVHRYNGHNTSIEERYVSRGSSSGEVLFDDYGRPLWKHEEISPSQSNKVVKAAPKEESPQDVGSGVLKFRVLLLSEGSGQSDMDVLCQIGLDGIRLLDLDNYRSLRIYPIDTVTKWEVIDSYTFVFGAKSSMDGDLKRIRLKSNSYTTNNILDAVTAASIQFKEIGSSYVSSSGGLKSSDPRIERKKGIVDWLNIIMPKMEEKDHWIPDEAVTKCNSCGAYFGPFLRRHHCRNCGDIFCVKCTQGRISLTTDKDSQPVRVCDRCMAEVTHRLVNSKEGIARVDPLLSHDDLAKKLKEKMEKNRKTGASTGLKSHGSGNRMKEVACPTCTVHLQVQLPFSESGSETVECSVCLHPFSLNSYY